MALYLLGWERSAAARRCACLFIYLFIYLYELVIYDCSYFVLAMVPNKTFELELQDEHVQLLTHSLTSKPLVCPE